MIADWTDLRPLVYRLKEMQEVREMGSACIFTFLAGFGYLN